MATSRATKAPGQTRLTPREQQVMELVAAGAANKRIARTLGMSEHTVKFHLASVFRKLDAANRTEASATYLRSAATR